MQGLERYEWRCRRLDEPVESDEHTYPKTEEELLSGGDYFNVNEGGCFRNGSGLIVQRTYATAVTRARARRMRTNCSAAAAVVFVSCDVTCD